MNEGMDGLDKWINFFFLLLSSLFITSVLLLLDY